MIRSLRASRLLPLAAAAALAVAALPAVASADDVTPPETTISYQPDALTTSTTAYLWFSGNDDSGDPVTFECSVDGADAEPCDSPAEFPGMSDGDHTITVTAIDASGNREATPETASFKVDTVGPTAVITDAPSGSTQADASNLHVTFSSPDSDVDHFECYLDGELIGGSSCTSPLALPTLADGVHDVEVIAYDAAGNRTDDTPSADFTLDHVAPTSAWTTTPPVLTNGSEAYFEWEGSDQVGDRTRNVLWSCSVDGGAYAPCTDDGEEFLTGLAEGAHTLSVKALDAAGNAGPTLTHAFRVDRTAPAPTVNPLANALSTDAVTMSGTGSRADGDLPGVTVAIVADTESQAVSPLYEAPAVLDADGHWTANVGKLPAGRYRAYACQFDTAGNYDCQHVILTVVDAPTAAPAAVVPAPAAPAPAPAAPAAAPTAKQVKSSVADATVGLGAMLKGLGLGMLSPKGAGPVPFKAPGAGTVKVQLTAPAAKGKKGKKAAPVVLATGTKTVGGAGVATVKLTPTKAGAATLKQHKTTKITVSTTFTPKGGKAASSAQTVTVKPGAQKQMG